MSIVVGCDFDSWAAHFALLDEERNYAEPLVIRFGAKGHDAFDRARRIRDAMPPRGWWADQGVIAMGIEDPRGAARNVDSVLYRVQGSLLACLPMELAVVPWKPLQWRKICGVGMRGKETIAAFADERWLNMPRGCSQDLKDGFCLAWATRARLTRRAM